MARMKLGLVLGGLLGGALICPQTGAQAPRQRVTVTCACDDSTGKAYVEALRSALAQSTHYREVGSAEGYADNVIRINIVSLPLPNVEGRPQAALSIVCLHDGALMHQFVETCTRIPIADCAKAMVADLSNWNS